MDQINIEGVILSPLKKVYNPKGDIFHGMKKSDNGFTGFGEAYFSMVKHGEIKGWNRHKEMTLNLIVPIGKVVFVLYDDREKSRSKGNFLSVILSPSNYHRLTVPLGLWIAFKGIDDNTNLILNIANMEHDTIEMDRLELNQIYYNWKSV